MPTNCFRSFASRPPAGLLLADVALPPVPEDDCDRSALKRCIFSALTESLSIHHQIKDALSDAGFRVSRIQKHDFHDVWEIRMERGEVMFNDNYVQIRRRIRRVLRAEKLYSKFEGMEVGFQGKRLVVGFCSKLGPLDIFEPCGMSTVSTITTPLISKSNYCGAYGR